MIRVAVIGTGSIACKVHIPILRELECTIDGLMSRSVESAQRVAERFGVSRIYRAVDEIQADCAFVLTPKETHAEIAGALLQRGIHVFLEKPMATTLRDAETLVQVAERNGVLLMVGFNRRYAPVYERFKAEWSGHPPDLIVAQKNRPGTEYRATLENAIHMVDVLRWVCGEATIISAGSQFEDPYFETSCVAYLRFQSTLALLVANRSCGQWMEHLDAYGGRKTVSVDVPERVVVLHPTHELSTSETPLAMGWASVHDRLGFRQEVEDFLRAIREGTPTRIPPRDALQTHRLMDDVLRVAGLPGMNG